MSSSSVTGTTAATTKTASLDELKKWAGHETELEVLREDDIAPKDGKISVAEISKATIDPAADAKFISSEAVYAFKKTLGTADEGHDVQLSDLKGWQLRLATLADGCGTGGRKDKKLKLNELTAYLKGALFHDWTPSPEGQPRIVTDQRLAVMKSAVANLTGEPDYMDTGTKLRLLDAGSFKVAYDDAHRIPHYVIHSLSHADLETRPNDPRGHSQGGSTSAAFPEKFYSIPELMELGIGADTAWFKGTGQDNGHNNPYADYGDGHAADMTFGMWNIAPEAKELNRNAWEKIEAGTRDLIEATGGNVLAEITGNDFLDEKGKPVPDSKIEWIGPDKDVPNGKRRCAVPTHWYKAVLLQLPDGSKHMFAWRCLNSHDVPTKGPEMKQFILDSEISVKDLCQIAGDKFFRALPTAEWDKLASNPHGLAEVASTIKSLPETGAKATAARKALPDGATEKLEGLKIIWPKGVAMPKAA